MSGPLVLGAIKLVGGVMAAKTAVEGIKEGNLLKAVVGGVGAYFSLSGLAAGASGAGAAAGTEVAKEAAVGGATAGASGAAGTTALTEMNGSLMDNALSEVGKNAFGEVGKSAAQDVAGSTLMNAANDGVVKNGLLDRVGGFIGDNKAGNWISSLNDKGAMFGQGGGLERLGSSGFGSGKGGPLAEGGLLGSDYAKGQAISGGMQLAGGYMQGKGMEEQAKWKLEQDRQDYEGQRARRAAVGDMSFMNDLKWNPQSGRFEQAQTA